MYEGVIFNIMGTRMRDVIYLFYPGCMEMGERLRRK